MNSCRQHHAELIQNIAAHCKQHCSNVIHVVVLQQYCNHALRISWQCSFDVGVLPEFQTDGPQSLLRTPSVRPFLKSVNG